PVLRWLIVALCVAWSLFQLWAVWAGTLNPQRMGAIHLAFAMAIVFLAFPASRSSREHIPSHDWLLAAAGLTGSLYIVVDYYQIVAVQGGMPIARDVWIGSLLLVVLAIAAHRGVGLALPIIAGLTILYGITGPAG